MTKKTKNVQNKVQNNTKATKTEGQKPNGIMKRAVTGFSFLGILQNIGGVIFGLILILIGLYIRSYDDIPHTEIQAQVSSVTWENIDGCKSTESTKKRGGKQIQWHCDVVAKYNGGSDVEKEYNFSSIGAERYVKNQSMILYRINADETITHHDPNAWKNLGWIFLGLGVLFTSSGLFWLWICTRPWGKEICAAKVGTELAAGAFSDRD